MRSSLCLVLISLCAVVGFGQNGYNGKRFVFCYSPAYSVDINGLVGIGHFFVSHHHKLEVGASFGDRVQLNLNVEQSMTFKNEVGESQVDKTLGGNILFYKNRKGNYTPIGAYIGLGLNVGTQQRSGIEDVDVYDQYGNYESSYDVAFNEQKKLILLSMYTGQSYIIYQRIFIGYGVQWGIPLDSESYAFRHFAKPFFKLGIAF